METLTFEEKIKSNFNQLEDKDVIELCDEVLKYARIEYKTNNSKLCSLGELSMSVLEHIKNYKTLSFKQYKVLKGYISSQRKIELSKNNNKIMIIK